MTQCENMGSIVGNKQCPNESTHRIVLTDGGDDYESFLCPTCFTGFREEMVKQGLRPKNEAAPEPSVEIGNASKVET